MKSNLEGAVHGWSKEFSICQSNVLKKAAAHYDILLGPRGIPTWSALSWWESFLECFFSARISHHITPASNLPTARTPRGARPQPTAR